MQALRHLTGGGLALLTVLIAAGTALAQSPPTNVQAVAQAATTVNITWTGAAGAIGYHVQRGPTAAGGWTKITATRLPATATSHVDAAATAGATRCYRVQAVYSSTTKNSPGVCVTTPASGGGGPTTTATLLNARVLPERVALSARSTLLLTATPEITKTEVVNNMQGQVAVGSCLNVEWQAVPNATGYRLQRSVPQMAPFTITPTGLQGTSWRDCSVPGNLDVSYAVFAQVPGNPVEIESAPHTLKTPSTLGIIMSIAGKFADGALTYTWTKNPGAVAYEIRSPAFLTQETAGIPLPDGLNLTHVFRPNLPQGWTTVYVTAIFDLGSGRLPGQTYTLSVWVP